MNQYPQPHPYGRTMNGSAITADTTPDSAWGCVELVIWHKRLVEAHGQEQANELFMLHYDDLSAWNSAKNSCRYNNGFVNYFLQQGLDLRSWMSAIFTNVTDIAVNTSDDLNESVSNSSDAIRRTTATAGWVLPVALVTVAGGALLYLNGIAKNIKEKTD